MTNPPSGNPGLAKGGDESGEAGQPPEPVSAGNAGSGWFLVARILLGVAIAGAGYLALAAIRNGPVAGCGPGSGCDKVLQSRWAYWLNLPVSLPALLVYVALFAAVRRAEKQPLSPEEERGAWTAIIPLACMVAGAALWFVGLQAIVIKAFCKFCMAAHTCGLAAAAICLYHIPVTAEAGVRLWGGESRKRGVPFKGVFLLGVLGCAGLALLTGGQLLVQKERNVVSVFPGGPPAAGERAAQATKSKQAATSAAVTSLPHSPNLKRLAPGVLSIYDGKFVLPLNAVPMIGSAGASNIIVNLFDYTCPHCRSQHPILVEAQQALSNQLGIVCLPLPMSTNCNPVMLPKWPSVSNSCEYARLFLAVYYADPAQYRRFDDWLFGQPEAAPFEAARAFAGELVGTNRLAALMADPAIDQQILTACNLHWSDYEATGIATMPHLIMGPVISAGPLNSTTHLLVLLEKYLGIKMPPDKAPGPPGRPY